MDIRENNNEAVTPKKPKYILLKILGILFGLFIILAIISFPLKTVNYTVYSSEITEKIRILQISDLHSCSYGKDMSTLTDAIKAADPDIIVLTGDIYDDEVDNTNTRTFLKSISYIYPCYYITGNHEMKIPDTQSICDEARRMGITVLEGENITIGEITICGAAASADGTLNFADSVKKCADNAGDGFNILLAHYPDRIDYYRSFEKFDLVLSGHAHGGHWRVPFFINGLYAPGQGLFPEYAGGRFDFEDCVFIVSRGLSRTKNIIPRIFNNPEAVVIDILPESE